MKTEPFGHDILLSLQQKIMLCTKQEKNIYKGYFTYQANIIGYATY